MYSADNLIWIDLEMTGLDPASDRIIEIATVVTNAKLDVLAEGPVLAIHTPETVLTNMNEWNQTHHRDSGLLQRVRDSHCDTGSAEQQTLEFLQTLVPSGTSPMCGKSICQDRRFMARLMPRLEAWFHYRHIDVSTIQELCRRWTLDCPPFDRESRHLALQDIHDSIDELRHYRQWIFKT